MSLFNGSRCTEHRQVRSVPTYNLKRKWKAVPIETCRDGYGRVTRMTEGLRESMEFKVRVCHQGTRNVCRSRRRPGMLKSGHRRGWREQQIESLEQRRNRVVRRRS
jgi:hypothetical protein